MKKYSQRGDRMDVKSRMRKESFERKPQRDLADKTYDYSIDCKRREVSIVDRKQASTAHTAVVLARRVLNVKVGDTTGCV